MHRLYWLIAVVLTTLALWGGVYLVQRTFATSIEYRQVDAAYARSVDVLRSSDGVLLALYNAQRGARGYLLTQDWAYAEPFERGSAELPKKLERLRGLFRGTAQEQLVHELEQSATGANAIFRKIVTLTRAGNSRAALDVVRSGEGKRLTDRSAALSQRIQQSEQSTVNIVKARARQAAEDASLSARGLATMGGVSVLLMIMGGWLFFQARHRTHLAAHRAKAEADMAATLAQMQTIVETVPLGLVLAELPSGRIVGGNTFVEKMLRHPVLYSPDVNSYDEWVSYHADGTRVDGSEYPLARMVMAGEENPNIEVNYQRGDGTRAWVRIMGRPVRNGAGELTGGVVALVDVDEERKAKEKLEAALLAKDNLLYEVNHRVKNSLQLVVGMLALEAARTQDPAGREAIMSARAKVGVVAQIHQKLYSASSHTAIDFCAYLDELARGIIRSAGHSESGLHISCEGHPMVPIDVAAPLSLVVNELATNAVKYAFGGEDGKLSIRFSQSIDELTLEVEDNGCGLPPEFDLASPKSMGMKIVLGLVRQIGATIEASDMGTGAKFQIRLTSRFPNSGAPEAA